MPRTARIDIPDILQHVIVRGIEKRDIFTDDEDRRFFVKRFSHLLIATETECLAWAILSNHFHLLLRPRRTTLGSFMRRLLTGYAVTFNLRHKRSGYLFQNRYKSIICDEEEYLLELVRYIHLNPLRAGIVPSLDELDRYPWSGQAVLLGNSSFAGQETTEILTRFGKSLPDSRQNYRAFVEDGISMGNRPDLVGGKNKERQSSDNDRPQDSRVLGGESFLAQILPQPSPVPEGEKLPLQEIVRRVCERFTLSAADLKSKYRSKKIVEARSIICHAAMVQGHRGVDIAPLLGFTPSGVTVAARRGEKVVSEYLDLFKDLRSTDKSIC